MYPDIDLNAQSLQAGLGPLKPIKIGWTPKPWLNPRIWSVQPLQNGPDFTSGWDHKTHAPSIFQDSERVEQA